MTITPGSRLGQYEIVSLIGGGMVYTLPGQTKIKECVITREAVLVKDIPTTLVEKSGIR